MSTNPLNDISRVYLEQVAVEEGVRPGSVEKPLDKAAFKKRRRSLAGKEKSAEARARGHEGKTWADSGRTYSPDEAKSGRAKMSDLNRSQRYRVANDPDSEHDDYPAQKTKNPKKLRKQKAMGEIGESAVPGKPAEKLGAVSAIPQDEREAARKRTLEKAAAIRAKKGVTKKTLDPVGKEDSDVDNDGKNNTNADKYLLNRRKAIGKAVTTQEAKRWWDDDGDGKGYEEGEVSGKFKKKKVKESFSNWRQDLSEVIEVVSKDKGDEKITEKTVKNKIKINPNIGEAVETLGGTLLEMVEIDEVDYIVESVYDELLEEGYGEDDIEEALEFALTEAKVTFGHDTATGEKKAKKSNLLMAVGRLARQKLSSKVRGAKKAAKQAVATGARKVAKGALGVARKMEGGDKKPSTAQRKPSTYRGAGAGTKERVSSGSYTPPTKKKAEKPADPWKGSSTVPQKPKPKPKADKPSDPWEGSATTPAKPKAKTKKPASPKSTTKTTKVTPKPEAKVSAATKKKRKSKLDSLLADIRSEATQFDEQSFDITPASHRQQQRIQKATDLQKATKGAESSAAGAAVKRLGGSGISLPLANSYEMNGKVLDEKTLTSKETKEKERIVKSMKSKAADFEKRYPGRGKEVMYATATKIAKTTV